MKIGRTLLLGLAAFVLVVSILGASVLAWRDFRDAGSMGDAYGKGLQELKGAGLDDAAAKKALDEQLSAVGAKKLAGRIGFAKRRNVRGAGGDLRAGRFGFDVCYALRRLVQSRGRARRAVNRDDFYEPAIRNRTRGRGFGAKHPDDYRRAARNSRGANARRGSSANG